jgi:hypothetical protein
MSERGKLFYPCGNDDCENVGIGYKKCGRCNVQRYCSKQCQKTHWKKHKCVCKRLESVPSEARVKSKILKNAVRKNIGTLGRINKAKGGDKGVFLLDLNTVDTGVLQWEYFNFTRDDWQTKLEVSAVQVDTIQRQQREQMVCGLLLGNRIEIVFTFLFC